MDTMYGTALCPNLNHPNELPDPDLHTVLTSKPSINPQTCIWRCSTLQVKWVFWSSIWTKNEDAHTHTYACTQICEDQPKHSHCADEVQTLLRIMKHLREYKHKEFFFSGLLCFPLAHVHTGKNWGCARRSVRGRLFPLLSLSLVYMCKLLKLWFSVHYHVPDSHCRQ